MTFTPEIFQVIYGVLIFCAINLLFLANQIRDHDQRYVITFCLVCVISLVVGVRGLGVGVDSANYALFFSGEYVVSDIREPVFFLIRWLSVYDPDIAFVVIALATNILFFLAYKNLSRNYPILLALHLSTFYFINMNINIIRQGLAMALFAYAVTLMLKKSNRKYWLYFLAAIMTHYSAVVVVVPTILVIVYERYGRSAFPIIFVAGFIFYFVKLSIVLHPFVEYSGVIAKAYWVLSWPKVRPWHFKHIYYLIVFLAIALVALRWHLGQGLLRGGMVRAALVLIATGFVLVFLFKEEEMFADRIFYYYLFLVPFLLLAVTERIKPALITTFLLLCGADIWFIKSIYIQYSGWFVPPFEFIR